jgi:RNA polymerase primary sigma factor
LELLSPDEEQRLGRRIKESQDAIFEMILEIETSFVPFRNFQDLVRDWLTKKKTARESIESIFEALDQMLDQVDHLDRPRPELTEFAIRVREVRSDLSAAMDQMVVGNLRLAVSIAKKFCRRGLPLADLIQEANLGLIKAVARFDYTTGHRFSTFASWWIRQSIYRALCDNGRTIRLPVHVQEMRNQFHRAFFELLRELGREPTYVEVADRAGLSVKKVLTIIQMNREPVSLETPLSKDGDLLGDLIENQDSPSPLEATLDAEMMNLAESALNALPLRERQILSLRFGLEDDGPYTLEELGRTLGISRERVRQLEQRALKRIRRMPIHEDLITDQAV